MTNMAHTMAKIDTIILPLQHRVMFATGTCDFRASVESSVRFHSEILMQSLEFIGRQTDQTIHGKTLSRPVNS